MAAIHHEAALLVVRIALLPVTFYSPVAAVVEGL
jgi:hypothetical protein